MSGLFCVFAISYVFFGSYSSGWIWNIFKCFPELPTFQLTVFRKWIFVDDLHFTIVKRLLRIRWATIWEDPNECIRTNATCVIKNISTYAMSANHSFTFPENGDPHRVGSNCHSESEEEGGWLWLGWLTTHSHTHSLTWEGFFWYNTRLGSFMRYFWAKTRQDPSKVAI